jgi:hypothetical protein
MLNTRVIRICFSICCLSGYLRAQPPAFRMQSYIEMYSEEAIYQMLEYKIPASVTLAQAIFESQSGGSYLARKSNNHFGIKCHLEWGGDTVAKHDDTLNECFRKYRLVADSYTDHSMFLRSRARYSSLFELPLDDYKSWCYGLKAAGYATYPSYAEDLITIIEQFRLYELDGYQSLDAVNVFNQRNHEAISGPPTPNCSLQDLARTGLLWTDEKDLLIQSLELLIEGPLEADETTVDAEVPAGLYGKTQEQLQTMVECEPRSEPVLKENTETTASQQPGEADQTQTKENNNLVSNEEGEANLLTQPIECDKVAETAAPKENITTTEQAPAEEIREIPATRALNEDNKAAELVPWYIFIEP